MTCRRAFNIALLLAAACLWGNAHAASLIPDADTRLSNDTDRGPTSNTGSSSVWEVRWHSAPRVRIGYVRYDISGINPALFGSATLSGTFTDSGRNGPSDGSGMWNVYGLNDTTSSGLGNSWDESAVNYSNASGVDNSAAVGTFAFNSDATFLGTMSFDGVDVQPLPFSSNTADLDLSAFLNADTDGLVTLMFMDVDQRGHEYRINSKEGSTADGHGPMRLNFVPEPSSIALVALALAGVGFAVRRSRS
ncbi:PEP-CTERM sorting domain-containing protein [Aeoliella sp.]|uniref:PEP-CTERM sorting domain-containing protein n=1 Tax=Aeoliella sp. TaxID=2795800 RepID=UPI003CCBD050